MKQINYLSLLAFAALFVASCRTHQPCPGVGSHVPVQNKKTVTVPVQPAQPEIKVG